LGIGLVERASIVSGDVAIGEKHSKNNNFIVEYPLMQHGGCVVKQVPRDDPYARETLFMESKVYDYVGHDSLFDPLKKTIPSFLHYDHHLSILVIEYLKDYKSLQDLQMEGKILDELVAETLGQAVANIHISLEDRMKDESFSNKFRKIYPWVFFIPRDGIRKEGNPHHTKASTQMEKLIMEDREFCSMIEEVKSMWRPGFFIHGDMKWSNLLINEKFDLRIIDWETSDIGDPYWDVAGILHNYIFNAYSMNQRDPSNSMYTIQKMQSCAHRFLHSYLSHSSIKEREFIPFRLLPFIALRLIQTAVESTGYYQELPENTLKMISLSRQILMHPEEAAVELLALNKLRT
jgi:thiamine kinase-like enzyme